VDEKLVRDVAAAGGGSEEFSPNTGDLEAKVTKTWGRGGEEIGREEREEERLTQKQVIRQLKRAMGLEMKNMKINWGELPVGKLSSAHDSANLHVFKGEKLVLYAILDEQQPEKDKEVLLALFTPPPPSPLFPNYCAVYYSCNWNNLSTKRN
jgi:hypothetical protein